MSTTEAAKLKGVSRQAINLAIRRGEIDAEKIGGRNSVKVNRKFETWTPSESHKKRGKKSSKTTRWSFKLKEAFPSDSIIARWLIGLSAAVNDIILAGSSMEREIFHLSPNTPSSEGLYFFRLVASHYREVAKFLHDANKHTEIKDFIETLKPEIQQDYQALLSTFTPFKGSFVEQTLKPLRDEFFHYPNANSEELQIAVEKLRNLETGMELKGERRIADFRSVFADDVMLCLSGEIFDQDEPTLGEAISNTRDALQNLVVFHYAALMTYLSQLPSGVVKQKTS